MYTDSFSDNLWVVLQNMNLLNVKLFFLLQCATADSEFHANGQFQLVSNYWISILRSNFNEGKKMYAKAH